MKDYKTIMDLPLGLLINFGAPVMKDNFLGYPRWSELLSDDKQAYLNRVIQFTSHSTLSNEEVAMPTAAEKQTVKFLLDNLIDNHGFWQQGGVND